MKSLSGFLKTARLFVDKYGARPNLSGVAIVSDGTAASIYGADGYTCYLVEGVPVSGCPLTVLVEVPKKIPELPPRAELKIVDGGVSISAGNSSVVLPRIAHEEGGVPVGFVEPMPLSKIHEIFTNATNHPQRGSVTLDKKCQRALSALADYYKRLDKYHDIVVARLSVVERNGTKQLSIVVLSDEYPLATTLPLEDAQGFSDDNRLGTVALSLLSRTFNIDKKSPCLLSFHGDFTCPVIGEFSYNNYERVVIMPVISRRDVWGFELLSEPVVMG